MIVASSRLWRGFPTLRCVVLWSRSASSDHQPIAAYPFYPHENANGTNFEELQIVNTSMDEKSVDWWSFPGVTTILSQTRSVQSNIMLSRWREKKEKELGSKEAVNEYMKERKDVGHSVHKLLCHFFRSIPESQLVVPEDSKVYWNGVRPLLERFSNVRHIEQWVYHEDGRYKGVIDAIGEYDGVCSLIDWKTSEAAKKTIGDLYEYPLQVAAYAGAVNNMCTLSSVRQAVVVIVNASGAADLHVLSSDDLQDAWNNFKLQLEQYHKQKEEKRSKKVENRG